VISSPWGGRRYLPYAFTEHGVSMASTVLKSPRAIAVSIEIIRIFVRLRHLVAINADVARRIDRLEATLREHASDNDKHFRVVFEALRKLMAEPVADGEEPPRRIGFQTE
jgi:hypothetical protein